MSFPGLTRDSEKGHFHVQLKWEKGVCGVASVTCLNYSLTTSFETLNAHGVWPAISGLRTCAQVCALILAMLLMRVWGAHGTSIVIKKIPN